MLHESDVRAMIRIFGDVAALRKTLSEKRRSLLSKLCELVDGDGWAWSLSRRLQNGESKALDGMLGGRHFETGPRQAARLLPAAGGDVDGEGLATEATHGQKQALTFHQISDDVVSLISIARRADREPFTRRESKMVEIILSEISWLHEQPEGKEKIIARPAMSPRQRATLIYLVDGLSREDIAIRLDISCHTVCGYIKEIYKHYRVNSRAELLQQFTQLGHRKSGA